jgi:hypothetical protein
MERGIIIMDTLHQNIHYSTGYCQVNLLDFLLEKTAVYQKLKNQLYGYQGHLHSQ